jgi:glycosyltransferase involved in cell wall biosynthesis
MEPKRLLYFVNSDWFFVSHRLVLAKAAQELGYEVHLVTSFTDKQTEIEAQGIHTHHLPIERSGTNPFKELLLILRLVQICRTVKPSLIHAVTPKCVIYGSLVCRLLSNLPGVAAISGLGSGFTKTGVSGALLRHLIAILYRLALSSERIELIFQNKHDLEVFKSLGIAKRNKVHLIPGSGVDLSQFCPSPEPSGTPAITFASRLLREKGVIEFIDAAQILHEKGIAARWVLAGKLDSGNCTSITLEEIKSHDRHQIITFIGYCTDLPKLLSETNIFVLPSYYREGLPKALIEAAAAGRAVVTTENPGCIDAIIPEKTGIAVPIRDCNALSSAIERLILNHDLRQEMGHAGRLLAENNFSIKGVRSLHMNIYVSLTNQKLASSKLDLESPHV